MVAHVFCCFFSKNVLKRPRILKLLVLRLFKAFDQIKFSIDRHFQKYIILVKAFSDNSKNSTFMLTSFYKIFVYHKSSRAKMISRNVRAEFARCCSYYDDFKHRHRMPVERIVSQGHRYERLRNSFKKLYGRYQDLIVKITKVSLGHSKGRLIPF